MPDPLHQNKPFKPGQNPFLPQHNQNNSLNSNQNTLQPKFEPVFQSQSLGAELQQNNTVVGAYGQFQNPQSTVQAPTQNLPQSNLQANPQAYQQINPQNYQPIMDVNAPGKSISSSNLINSQTDAFESIFQNQPNQQTNSSTNQALSQNNPPNSQQNIQNPAFYGNNQPLRQPNATIPNQQYLQPGQILPSQNLQQNSTNPQRNLQNSQNQAKAQTKKSNGFFSWLNPAPKPTRARKVVDKASPSYLQMLSPQELRKEVIQTEISIQKTLLESEKNYRKDTTTIRDLIAPSSVNIMSGQMELGTKLIRSFFVLTYSRIITSGWLEGIINADIPIDLSIYIYPEDSGDVLKDLKNKVGKIQASLQINAEKGMARDPALETAYRDVEALRDAIQQGVEKFFKIGVYIQVYADSQDQLERNSQFVESMFDQQNIIIKRAALQMDDGFNACLPILKDDLYVYSNMNTSPLSACFPFVSSDLSSNTGILYGINRHNSSLVIYDRFDLENANSVVFATTGAGKSYAVKLEILRSLMMGTSVIVIDPEQEYKMLADTVGGAYINMSLNSTNRINPFDLPKALPGESTSDILRSATIDIIGLINLMLGKMNPEETSVMERAIMESYAKRDITSDSDFGNITPPTMSDLVEILNGIVGGESLAQRLYRYTEGTFAGIFNRQTNINAFNEFVVFNIRDLQDELRPIAMYVLLKYVWNEIRSNLKRRILVCDEAWIMMQYEDSAKFLFGLVKRARKYYLGVTTITQDVSDFLNSPWGKPIVTNAAMKILLKQSPTSIDLVAQTFNLTSGEKQVLLDSEVGQGIFFAGTRHVAIGIIAFPTEHRIITTNPKDILKMQGLEDAGNNS